MSNFDTLDAITDNLETVLGGLGIKFSTETYDDLTAVPAGLLPLGLIFFDGADFEYTHGEKPEYAEARFTFNVVIQERDPRLLTRQEQSWLHAIRDALTVTALNVGVLVSSKLVSRVSHEDNSITHDRPQYGVLSYRLRVRYREA